MKWPERVSVGAWLLVGAALIASQALVLFAMGQPPICACGYVRFWGGIVSGPEISQQLTDWYTYSHVIHGIGFYFALWFVAPRAPVSSPGAFLKSRARNSLALASSLPNFFNA